MELAYLSTDFKNFLQFLLEKDPARRIDLETALQSSWILKFNDMKNQHLPRLDKHI